MKLRRLDLCVFVLLFIALSGAAVFLTGRAAPFAVTNVRHEIDFQSRAKLLGGHGNMYQTTVFSIRVHGFWLESC